mmetsp:Transcript_9766/g.36732  ORF Transcript_9766/g.36732 Transcript_9766/m.36732 type:complete len:218 (+) Transcript_9766:478-1131(+)
MRCVAPNVLLDLDGVCIHVSHHNRSSLTIQRVGGVGVPQQLWQEDVENVHEVEHRRPRLVDHVQADRARYLINVWMVHPVGEADGRRLEGIVDREGHVHLPDATHIRSCRRYHRVRPGEPASRRAILFRAGCLTFAGPVKLDEEVVAIGFVRDTNFVVGHHELDKIGISAAAGVHLGGLGGGHSAAILLTSMQPYLLNPSRVMSTTWCAPSLQVSSR